MSPWNESPARNSYAAYKRSSGADANGFAPRGLLPRTLPTLASDALHYGRRPHDDCTRCGTQTHRFGTTLAHVPQLPPNNKIQTVPSVRAGSKASGLTARTDRAKLPPYSLPQAGFRTWCGECQQKISISERRLGPISSQSAHPHNPHIN